LSGLAPRRDWRAADWLPIAAAMIAQSAALAVLVVLGLIAGFKFRPRQAPTE
jgi:hypothetical protein